IAGISAAAFHPWVSIRHTPSDSISDSITDNRVVGLALTWFGSLVSHGVSVNTFRAPSDPRTQPPPVHVSIHVHNPPLTTMTGMDVASVITWCSGLPLLSHGSGVPPYRSAIWSINAWLGEVNRNRSSLDGRVFPPLPVATFTPSRIRPSSAMRRWM